MAYRFQLSRGFETLEKVLIDIRSHFAAEDESIHKARNVLKVMQLGDVTAVVKSFKIPHLLNRIIYTYFRRSKAKTSYDNAMILTERGIHTPHPVGYIEFFETGLLKESFFLSEHFAYDFTIREVLLGKNFENREAIFKQFAAFTSDLHQKGVWHLDYSPGNILIKQENDNYIFSIVDINRMNFRTITPLQGLENFNKLWADPDDMTIIATEYAAINSLSTEEAVELALHYDAKNKAVKNFKKRLKGKQ